MIITKTPSALKSKTKKIEKKSTRNSIQKYNTCYYGITAGITELTNTINKAKKKNSKKKIAKKK